MSLMCTEAELPGTAYNATSAIGHYQGVQESFATLRDYPPLNLTFYVDADHVMIEVFESWMDYINPTIGQQASNSFKRLRYPKSYKEIIHITKYERDTFKKKTSFIPANNIKSSQLHYEFINVWPTNMSSMKVNYGQSNVLKLSVQLAYDRYRTSNSTDSVVPTITNLPETGALDTPVNNQDPAPYTFDYKTNIITNEYYMNFGDNKQNATNSGDFFDGSNTGPFGVGFA